jgi:hypothetical protein
LIHSSAFSWDVETGRQWVGISGRLSPPAVMDRQDWTPQALCDPGSRLYGSGFPGPGPGIGDLVDRDRLETSGWIGTFTTGLAWRAPENWDLIGEIFYAPLRAVQDPRQGSQNDGLFNVRFQTVYRVR